jgi:acyl carrier protein
MAQDIVGADITEQIREVIERFGNLVVDMADLDDADDLFRAGMSSFGNISVMLALEESFNVEFPEPMLRRDTFETVASIRRAVLQLLEQ